MNTYIDTENYTVNTEWGGIGLAMLYSFFPCRDTHIHVANIG
jgi:hypothetical protein